MKRPYLALFLSFVFPGLGQIYNGQIQRGFILMVLFMVINFLANKPLRIVMEKGIENISIVDRGTTLILGAYSIAVLFLTVIAMVDAKLTAEKINSNNM